MTDPASPSSSQAPNPDRDEVLQPVAAVLAILLPGAGHAYLGEARRAVLIGAGVLGLFFGGMLIGGIGVVDRRENFIWFIGQAFVGPIAFGVDRVHQQHFKVHDQMGGRAFVRPPQPDEGVDPVTGEPIAPKYERSIGRVHELGTLFATIAGMLNLMVVIDAAFHAPRRRPARGGA